MNIKLNFEISKILIKFGISWNLRLCRNLIYAVNYMKSKYRASTSNNNLGSRLRSGEKKIHTRFERLRKKECQIYLS